MKTHRTIFIDLGAYNGDTIDIALNKHPSISEVYAFEPLSGPFQQMSDKFTTSSFHFFNEAAGTSNEKSRIYLGKRFGDIASSLDISNANCDPDNFEEIKVIDFPYWFSSTFPSSKKKTTIILKINIEGGEYSILENMMANKSIQYISKLYCDWHWPMLDMTEHDHHKFVQRLRSFGHLLGGDKCDEIYSTRNANSWSLFFRQQRIYYHRSIKLWMKSTLPMLFRFCQTFKRKCQLLQGKNPTK